MLVSILENGRHLGFLIGPSGRIDLVTIEMPYANFGACITICTIHPKNACYLLHYNLSLDAYIDKRIGKAASTLALLTARVWTSPKQSVKTKMVVYNACVTSTLMYGSETWTAYAGQEGRFNTFHLRNILGILGISWQDKVTNTYVLSRAGIPSMYNLLRQRRLRLVGHVCRMEDGRIPKDILYGELIWGGEPQTALISDINISA